MTLTALSNRVQGPMRPFTVDSSITLGSSRNVIKTCACSVPSSKNLPLGIVRHLVRVRGGDVGSERPEALELVLVSFGSFLKKGSRI